MAVLATDPALSFLSTVAGVTPQTVSEAIDFVKEPVWNGIKPTVVVRPEHTEAVDTTLRRAGFLRTSDRVLAIKELAHASTEDSTVVDARDADVFLDVLLAGYEVDGVLAAFIRAEHRLPAVRGFLVLERGERMAAGAMSLHGDVAVLGGAATLRVHRGKGAQTRLLRHRLRIAADAGCALAVATARGDSVSAANLRRAGFRLYLRTSWVADPAT